MPTLGTTVIVAHLERKMPGIKRVWFWIVAGLAAIWCFVFVPLGKGRAVGLRLSSGWLASSDAHHLDNSENVFQRTTWHLGNGTRTRGSTYGNKVARAYLGIQVTRVDSRVTPEEAQE